MFKSLFLNCCRWPLFIDPHSQANSFIRSFYSDRKLGCVKVSASEPFMEKLLNILRTALPDGDVVLLENVQETLDLSLDPLLFKETFYDGIITNFYL